MAIAPKRKKAAAKKRAAAPKRKKAAAKKRAAAPKRKKAAAKKRAVAPKRKKAAAKKRAVAPKRRKVAAKKMVVAKKRKKAAVGRKAAPKVEGYGALRDLLVHAEGLLSGLAALIERELGGVAAPKRKKRKKRKKAEVKKAATPKRKKASARKAAAPKRKKAAAKKRAAAPKRKKTLDPAHREAIRRGMLLEGCEVLTKTFLRGSAHGQLRSVHRDRERNKLKVAEFGQLIARGVVNLHDGTLTGQDFAKLEQLGIKVPPKRAGSDAAAPGAFDARQGAAPPRGKQSD